MNSRDFEEADTKGISFVPIALPAEMSSILATSSPTGSTFTLAKSELRCQSALTTLHLLVSGTRLQPTAVAASGFHRLRNRAYASTTKLEPQTPEGRNLQVAAGKTWASCNVVLCMIAPSHADGRHARTSDRRTPSSPILAPEPPGAVTSTHGDYTF